MEEPLIIAKLAKGNETMKKIGITGSIGTGKSVVSDYFRRLGHLVISADQINSELLEKEAVITKINQLLFNINSLTLDKKQVSKLIFSDEFKKKQLEDYLHPLIYAKIKAIIADNEKEKIVFLEIPLLYETNFKELTDYVIVVYASEQTQIKRIKARDNIRESDVKKRIKGQMPLKEKLFQADYVVDNSGTLSQTEKQLKIWYENYMRRL